MQVSQVKLCKLSGMDLALLVIKLIQEKGAKDVIDVHVKSFIAIIRKVCELVR